MKDEILKELIEINTTGDKENKQIRDYLKSILSPLNFKITTLGDGDKKVLIAKRGDSNLGFVCHTDTVSPSGSWPYNPYTLTIEDNLMYGLGTSDMKGGIAALLSALVELDTSYPCTLYFTYDEEINFAGIRTLVKELDDFPNMLIFPEPTDLVPVIASKGCLEFEVTVTGKSAHSSTPDNGDNAILKAMDFIKELKRYANNLKREINPIYEIPYTTFNLGIIAGGGAINKVPDECQLSFDFRTIDNKQNDKIIAKITKLCQKYNAKFKVINNVGAVRSNSSFNETVEKICCKKCASINYLTEASFFKDKAILILGPGPIMAHQTDEYIRKDSYLKTIEIYKEIIKKYESYDIINIEKEVR